MDGSGEVCAGGARAYGGWTFLPMVVSMSHCSVHPHTILLTAVTQDCGTSSCRANIRPFGAHDPACGLVLVVQHALSPRLHALSVQLMCAHVAYERERNL